MPVVLIILFMVISAVNPKVLITGNIPVALIQKNEPIARAVRHPTTLSQRGAGRRLLWI